MDSIPVDLSSLRSDHRRNIVIVGGGFAGVTLARHLERRLPPEWDLFLLSRTNLITYNPLLPEVVGASVLPGHVVVPLRRILKRTRIRMVQVQDIDFANRTVTYVKPIHDTIPFEHLVFAAGLDANLDTVPGMAQYGLPLKTLGDAMFLRNRVIGALEEATLTYDRARSHLLTNFIVVGGGFSGVEAAGEIHDLLQEAAPQFKRVTREQCRVHVVHSQPHLLPEVSESLGRYTETNMRQRGIEVYLGARVASVDAQGVSLTNGERIAGATVISTVGAHAHEFIACLPCADARGRLPTDACLRVQGTDRVWALGDCAVVPNTATQSPSPTTAQFAVQQARLLADNLLACLAERPPSSFHYKARGQLAAVGHHKAVAEIFGVRLAGVAAWLLWRAFYLARIPTFAWKVRLFLEWNWSLFFRKDISLMTMERSMSHERASEAPADIRG
ncbi:MAG: NAD(P)/FAD-dependent oxidoreductase [Pseudomonadales bacterium]